MVSTQRRARLTRLLRDAMGDQDTQPASLWNAIASQLLAVQVAAFLEGGEATAREQMHPSVVRAVALLRGPGAPASMGALARQCGMSESHLSRTFAAQVGQSVTEFRNQCRLGRFLDLYEQQPSENLLALAIDAGFGSYPQFHRVFTGLMGETPADYRRRVAGGGAPG